MTDENKEEQIRPDVLFGIRKSKEDLDVEDQEELEEKELGFVCHDCGWRGSGVEMEMVDGEFESVCGDCEGTNIENLLSTHIDMIESAYNQFSSEDNRFVSYSKIAESVDIPANRVDDAINHLLTRDNAWVMFENGEPVLALKTRER